MGGILPNTDALRAKLKAAKSPLYAVLDGAQIDDLPALLFDHDFSHKPLYRDMGSEDRAIALTAPQLVRFDIWAYWENESSAEARLDLLLSLLPLTGCAVFWEYAGEPGLLYRHLRTINNIMVPRDENTPPMPHPLDPDGNTFGNTEHHEQVLFRHADANVMGQVLPEMDAPQLSRILGPTSAVIFAPDEVWGGQVMRVDAPPITPEALKEIKRKPLQLTTPTLDRIGDRNLNGSRRKIRRYLRDVAADETADMSDDDVFKHVLKCEKAGNKLGLKSEKTHGYYAYLAVLTNGMTLTDPDVTGYISESPHPDHAVHDIMTQMSKPPEGGAKKGVAA